MGGILNREAFEPALINVAPPRNMVMSLGAHLVSRANLAHVPADFSVHGRLQNPAPMDGHQLASEDFDRIERQASH